MKKTSIINLIITIVNANIVLGLTLASQKGNSAASAMTPYIILSGAAILFQILAAGFQMGKNQKWKNEMTTAWTYICIPILILQDFFLYLGATYVEAEINSNQNAKHGLVWAALVINTISMIAIAKLTSTAVKKTKK